MAHDCSSRRISARAFSSRRSTKTVKRYGPITLRAPVGPRSAPRPTVNRRLSAIFSPALSSSWIWKVVRRFAKRKQKSNGDWRVSPSIRVKTSPVNRRTQKGQSFSALFFARRKIAHQGVKSVRAKLRKSETRRRRTRITATHVWPQLGIAQTSRSFSPAVHDR